MSHANSSIATSGPSALMPGSRSMSSFSSDRLCVFSPQILGGMNSVRRMHFLRTSEGKIASDIVLVWRRITGIIENWTSYYFETSATFSLEPILNPRFPTV